MRLTCTINIPRSSSALAPSCASESVFVERGRRGLPNNRSRLRTSSSKVLVRSPGQTGHAMSCGRSAPQPAAERLLRHVP